MRVLQAVVKGLPPLVVAVPCQLGEGAEAREEHVIEVVGPLGLVRDIGLAPESPLEPRDAAQLLAGHPLGP